MIAKGVFYNPDTKEVFIDGALVGYVVRRARVAAGTGVKNDRGTLAAGTRQYFWTAVPDFKSKAQHRLFRSWWRPGDGGSIGTRFATSEDAIDALVHYVMHVHSSADRTRWPLFRKAQWGF